MDILSLVLSKGSRFMRACNFHTGIAHAARRRKLENIDAQTTEGYRWTRELTLLVLVNSLKARHATACNASRHLRLIKRQTGRCAAASPLLNVSHLSPSFSTFETRRGETGRGVKRRSEVKQARFPRALTRSHVIPSRTKSNNRRKTYFGCIRGHSSDCLATLFGLPGIQENFLAEMSTLFRACYAKLRGNCTPLAATRFYYVLACYPASFRYRETRNYIHLRETIPQSGYIMF